MPRFSALLLFVLSLTAAPALAVNAPGAGRAHLDAFLAELDTFTATFEQQLFDEYGDLIEESRGDMAIARPGKFRWEYREPYEQLIVTNGDTLWVYDVDLEQVSVNPMVGDDPDSPAALLVGDIDLDSRYRITETPSDDGIVWVSLTPRRENAQYQAVEIGFDENGLHGMRLSDNLRQVTAITFANVARNVDIDPAEFAFEPPPGVDVLTNTPIASPALP